MRRILVLRGGALGDFIVTLPALAALRARWPLARIELVGNSAAAACAVQRHYLDAVHAQADARWSVLGAGRLDPAGPLARWLREFDLVINFWPDADGAIAEDFRRLGFLPCGERLPDSRWFLAAPAHPQCKPASRHYLEALRPLELPAVDLAPRLYPTSHDRRAADEILSPSDGGAPFIAWHPGSGAARKNWPLDRWLAVFAGLPESWHRHRVIVLLGEAELATWNQTKAGGRLPVGAIVLQAPSANLLAAVLERCALFLGHDSGPAHVAAAAGCPCLLVFGPTDPAMWAPPAPHVRVLKRGERTEDVTVADVCQALAEMAPEARDR